jgi:hypothetical protein
VFLEGAVELDEDVPATGAELGRHLIDHLLLQLPVDRPPKMT